ncbi:MAG TPA: DUF3147 family protein [Candidatus Binataceae bacterium]|nr:DUF3147 family protein [Candidatus Binataceae bacterium]
MEELILRFLIGGVIVSAFAVIGDLFEPKSFAGIFGAAPSVALATLALTITSKGKDYAATEMRSTIIGAFAFLVYAYIVGRVLLKHGLPTLPVCTVLIVLWIAVAIGGWAILLR